MTDPVSSPAEGPTRRRTPVLAGAGLLGLMALGLLWYATTGAPGADTGPAPGNSAGAADETHAPSLAETTGEEGTLKIEVVSLDRVASGMVELRLAVTHVGKEVTPLDIAQRFSADSPDRGTLAEVYLADLGHQRKLFILRDANGSPIGSRDDQPLAPRERRVLWARYPAPAEADDAVVVHVPHAEPMPNVPIAGSSDE